MVKLLRRNTFAVKEENGHSCENLCGSMLVYLYCQLTWS